MGAGRRCRPGRGAPGPPLPAQSSFGRRARRPRARGQRGGPELARTPARLHRGPAGPPLGDRLGAVHPGHGAGGQALGVDVPPLPGLRCPAAAGADLLRPRQPRRRIRRGPATHHGAHRNHGVDRTSPEVRGGCLPHRTRRSLGHPDGRGALWPRCGGATSSTGRTCRCA